MSRREFVPFRRPSSEMKLPAPCSQSCCARLVVRLSDGVQICKSEGDDEGEGLELTFFIADRAIIFIYSR